MSGAIGLGQPPLATVLLGHHTPDGSHHIDWMLARDSKNQQRLISFRLAERLDLMGAGAAAPAERVEDHRPLYLEYEGEVAGNRGSVRRLASGRVMRWRDTSPATMELAIHWSGGEENLLQHLALEAENPSQWLVKCVGLDRC